MPLPSGLKAKVIFCLQKPIQMKKDIQIPTVENIHIAVVKQFNEDLQEDIWTVFLINNSNTALDTIFVVSQAQGTIEDVVKETTTFRHQYEALAPFTALRVELMEKAVLDLENTFSLSYFQNGKLYDKRFVFSAQSVADHNTTKLPVLDVLGVLAV